MLSSNQASILGYRCSLRRYWSFFLFYALFANNRKCYRLDLDSFEKRIEKNSQWFWDQNEIENIYLFWNNLLASLLVGSLNPNPKSFMQIYPKYQGYFCAISVFQDIHVYIFFYLLFMNTMHFNSFKIM